MDTGMAHDAHQLLAALERRGIRPDDVRIVINTHFHIDHVSNNSLFPASGIYATQESFEWCHNLYSDLLDDARWSTLVTRYYPEVYSYDNAEFLMAKMRKIALRWWDIERVGSSAQFRWLEQHELPDGVEALMTSGHVPGHASLIIGEGSDKTIIAADALVTRKEDSRVLTMIPQDRAQYQRDRETILAFRGAIIPGHGPIFLNPGKEETVAK